jgi:hypothetical protein
MAPAGTHIESNGLSDRSADFDCDFMPARASVEERWKRIDRAFYRGEELPPVSLYKGWGFLLCR